MNISLFAFHTKFFNFNVLKPRSVIFIISDLFLSIK